MKKLFLILIAFFSVSTFSQDPFDRKQREQTESKRGAHPTAGVGLRVFGAETGGGTPIGSATYCWSRAIW